MDLFEHPHYRITKNFLLRAGIWPCQDGAVWRRVIAIIVYILFLTPLAIQAAVEWNNNIDAAIEVVPSCITTLLSLTKYVNAIINERKMKKLLRRIQKDSEEVMKLPQKILMEKGSMQGRNITIFYASYIFSATAMYALVPLTPILLNIVKPLNESREKKLLFEGEYFVDNEEYYYHIMLHEYACTFIVINILVAVDTMFMVYVQHACTLFTITSNCLKYIHVMEDGYIDEKRMKHLERNYNGRTYTEAECREIFEKLKHGIECHKNVLSFSKLLQSSFTTALAVQLLLTVIAISIAGIMILINLNNFDEAMRYVSFITGHLVHLFFQCFSGQRLLDYSLQSYKDACASMWYVLPKNIQYAYNFVLMRGSNPCKLTAGVFATMSMETYLSVTQTAMSYFTVLSSVR